jgi:hypothetical protein
LEYYRSSQADLEKRQDVIAKRFLKHARLSASHVDTDIDAGLNRRPGRVNVASRKKIGASENEDYGYPKGSNKTKKIQFRVKNDAQDIESFKRIHTLVEEKKNPNLDRTCSCLTCIMSRTLSTFWKSSIQLIDVFMTAYIIVLKDIQSKLPGIDAVKSLPKLEYMFTDPAACLERGLNVFRDIQKKGEKPETIEDVFAFLTIVYASAFTLHNNSNFTMLNTEILFQDALCWVAGVGELHQQERNVNFIANIWQYRCNGTSIPSTVEGSRVAASLALMENSCVKIFQDILDGIFCLYTIIFVYFILTA